MLFKTAMQGSCSKALLCGLLFSTSFAQQTAPANISFEAAVIQEAVIRTQLQTTAYPDGPPIMSNDSMSQLASVWSSMQPATVNYDTAALVEEITPPAGNSSNQPERRAGALRVLIVGDSMTHCNEGDYTWRYRIWQWFQAQNVAVNFIGPYVGTAQPEPAAPPKPPQPYGTNASPGGLRTSGGYGPGTGNWPSYHFAISGRSAAVDKDLIRDVVSNHTPDVMLVMLGFNDLGWFFSDDKGLLQNMKTLIDNARSVNPNIKFVIGTVPHRTPIGGRNDLIVNTDNYNAALKNSVAGWSTSSSPVTWAPVREEFDCGPQYSGDCPAAHDGLHPNELGEYQIARAFSRGLVSGLGIGSSPLAVPASIPSRNLPAPSNFQFGSSAYGATATWDAVYGAYSYDTEYVINGGAFFNFSPSQVSSNRWDTHWSVDGWSYQLRVRARAGNRVGAWSGSLTATAHPLTADSPPNVIVKPTSSGFDMSWGTPGANAGSISTYNILFYDLDGCEFLGGGGFKGTSGHVDALRPGHRYLTGVTAWNNGGEGLPTLSRHVIPGRGTPGKVQNLRIKSDQGGAVVHLTWDKVDGASEYVLYRRNVNEAGSVLEKASEEMSNCADYGFQFPGAWNYEWVVQAVNGNLEGPRSDAVLAPKPVDGETVATCPAPPGFCVPNLNAPPTAGTQPVNKAADPSPAQPDPGCTTTKTIISNKPMVVCGTKTSMDPSPTPYSFQARFTGNVAYGDIVPTAIVSAIREACTGGCNGALATSTRTALLLAPTDAPQDGRELLIPYVVTDQAIPDIDYNYFLDVMETIVKTVMSSKTFTWKSSFTRSGPGGATQNIIIDHGERTMWHGPSYVSGVRFALDNNGAYTLQAGEFGFAVEPYVEPIGISCEDIAGPLGAALGAIPGIGPVLGVLAATSCSVVNAVSG